MLDELKKRIMECMLVCLNELIADESDLTLGSAKAAFAMLLKRSVVDWQDNHHIGHIPAGLYI